MEVPRFQSLFVTEIALLGGLLVTMRAGAKKTPVKVCENTCQL